MKRGFTVTDLVIILGIIAIIAILMYPMFFRTGRGDSRQTPCLSNQKQIALAFCMYVQENDETMPVVDDNVFTTIGLHGKVLECRNDKGKLQGGYVVNAVLSRLGIGDVESPTAVWLTADGKANVVPIGFTAADMAARHAGGIIASYFDGHAAYSKTIAAVTDTSAVEPEQILGAKTIWNAETKRVTGNGTNYIVKLRYKFPEIKASTADNTDSIEGAKGLRPIKTDLLLPTRSFGVVIENLKYKMECDDIATVNIDFYIADNNKTPKITKIGKTFTAAFDGQQLIGKDYYIRPIAVVPSWDELRTMRTGDNNNLELWTQVSVSMSDSTGKPHAGSFVDIFGFSVIGYGN
jgi:prepilin-type processing-associated H-X9-DG protein